MFHHSFLFFLLFPLFKSSFKFFPVLQFGQKIFPEWPEYSISLLSGVKRIILLEKCSESHGPDGNPLEGGDSVGVALDQPLARSLHPTVLRPDQQMYYYLCTLVVQGVLKSYSRLFIWIDIACNLKGQHYHWLLFFCFSTVYVGGGDYKQVERSQLRN